MFSSQAQIASYAAHREDATVPKFGMLQALPFSVVMQNNQVMNRQFIDMVGIMPGSLVVARNRFEVWEQLLDQAIWFALGIAGSIALNRAVSNRFEQDLRRRYGIARPVAERLDPARPWYRKLSDWLGQMGRTSPLQVNWEWLDASGQFKPEAHQLAEAAKNIGCKSADELKSLLKKPDFVKRVMRGKLWILGADLILLAINGQKFFLRNWLTEKMSGKHGFSGEFTYADDNYRNQQAAAYERQRKKRMLASLLIGSTVGVAALPLLFRKLLSSQSPGRLARALKKLIPAFNYNNAIFCSKWVIGWGCAINYILPCALAARDKHERREGLVKNSVLSFFLFLGDALFGGLGAKFLQSRLRRKFGNAAPAIAEKGPLGLPTPVHLQTLLQKVDKTHPSYQWAVRNYWFGLAVCSLLAGLSMGLLNNWYTKKKVLAEQAALRAKPATQPRTQPPLDRHYAQRMRMLSASAFVRT